MTKHAETVGNTKIEIEDDDSLRIAGKAIDCEYDPESKTWSTRYLPYTSYASLLELARAIAADPIEFTDSTN